MKSISSLLVLLLFIVSVVFCYQHESVVSRAIRTRRNERKREAPSCASHSCASVNQACGWEQIEDVYFITNCNGGAVCNTTSSSSEDNVQGKCVKAPKLGEACVALKGHCEDGYICDYDNDKCVLDAPEITSYPPGHECTNDPFVACYFHNSTNQEVENLCVDGSCYFIPDWEPCFHTPSECHSTLSYCSACDVCTPYLYLGDECDSANDACNLHFYELCYPSNTSSTFGTCKKFHKGTQNQACTSDEHCAEGYFCPENEEGERLKTCQQFSKNTDTINQPCTSNDDCTNSNGEICSCVNGTTICAVNDYNVGFWDAFVDIEICGDVNSQCYAANGDYNQSCFAHSCKKELCKFTSVVGTDFFLSDSCELHGLLSSLCSSDSSSSSSSTTSSLSSSSSSEELDAIQSFASILTVTPLLIMIVLAVLFM